MSDNKVTLDQLDNSAVEAMSSSVGDVSMLNTENKTIVGAITEIVGKKEIANAIGEPLAETDKFTEMSSEINGLLSTFKTNMMNAGVVVESGDKFKALIDKIKGLTEGEGNKGIQFTEGVIAEPGGYCIAFEGVAQNVGIPTNIYVNTNLNFIPSLIAILVPGGIKRVGSETLHSSNIAITNLKDVVRYGTSCSWDISINDITENGFNITTTCSAELPSEIGWLYLWTTDNEPITWYAIGVGEEDTTLRDSLASILQEEGVNVTEEDTIASLITKVDEEFDRQVVPAGDAVASNVLSGKTFINNTGQVVTGTMVNRGGAQTITPGTSNKTLNAGYYSGNITIAGDADLIAANIVSGKKIFGVVGSATVKQYAEGRIFAEKSPVTVAGLSFKPDLFIISPDLIIDGNDYSVMTTIYLNYGIAKICMGKYSVSGSNHDGWSFIDDYTISNTSVVIPIPLADNYYTWKAYKF